MPSHAGHANVHSLFGLPAPKRWKLEILRYGQLKRQSSLQCDRCGFSFATVCDKGNDSWKNKADAAFLNRIAILKSRPC
jgi:hypothetical protein